MSRPLRIEFEGAVYHVTARGDRREPIFADDDDRRRLLAIVDRATERFDAQVLAYCLMGNHYHFVLHTRRANLSRLMRHVNGIYTQDFNRRHSTVGHLFQGRFKAVLVDRDAYLLEVCRYVELNPVRASLVDLAEAWPWSSYPAHIGLVPTPPWLDTSGLHGYLLGRSPRNAADHRRAAKRYAALVAAGREVRLWSNSLRQQIYLGDQAFVDRMQAKANAAQRESTEVPVVQRRSPVDLERYLLESRSREGAVRIAHIESGITMSDIARELGLSVSRISRLIARAESSGSKDRAKRKTPDPDLVTRAQLRFAFIDKDRRPPASE